MHTVARRGSLVIPPFGFDAVDGIGAARHDNGRKAVSTLRLDVVDIVGAADGGNICFVGVVRAAIPCRLRYRSTERRVRGFVSETTAPRGRDCGGLEHLDGDKCSDNFLVCKFIFPGNRAVKQDIML